MHTPKPSNETICRLVVDTDHYAGNFERQSIAYATGLTGECGVGSDLAELAQAEMSSAALEWWEDHGLSLPDEHGCHRPATIWPTPGFFNHGHGGHFPSTDEGRAQALVHFKEASVAYDQKQIDNLAHVKIGRGGWTQEGVDRERASREERIREVMAMTKVNEYPAFQSVAIEVAELPPPEIIEEFQKRMIDYLTRKNITVLDCAIETEIVKREVMRSTLPRP